MQSSSGQQQPPPPLSLGVAAELARLEVVVRQVTDPLACARLAGLGDAAASRVLRKIWEHRRRVQKLSAYIVRMAEIEVMERNAVGIPDAESFAPAPVPATQQQDDYIRGPLYYDDVQMENQSPPSRHRNCLWSFKPGKERGKYRSYEPCLPDTLQIAE